MTVRAFKLAAYRENPRAILDWAEATGAADVLDEEGEVRVCIRIPTADLPCTVCGYEIRTLRAALRVACDYADGSRGDRRDATIYDLIAELRKLAGGTSP